MHSATVSAPIVGRFRASHSREVMDHFRRNPRKIIQTIKTSFLPPTDIDGSRYGAICETSNLFTFVHASYELTTEENHLAAAIALIREHIYGEYILTSYEADRGRGYVFTFEAIAI